MKQLPNIFFSKNFWCSFCLMQRDVASSLRVKWAQTYNLKLWDIKWSMLSLKWTCQLLERAFCHLLQFHMKSTNSSLVIQPSMACKTSEEIFVCGVFCTDSVFMSCFCEERPLKGNNSWKPFHWGSFSHECNFVESNFMDVANSRNKFYRKWFFGCFY